MAAQLDVFKEIWSERPHFSQVSGVYLGEELNVWFMSHILPKSTYGRYKCNKENIILMTPAEHLIWEHSKSTKKDNPKWKWLFELKDKLTRQYNGVII